MNKKSIHQFVHTLSYGDAISSEVLAIKDFLQEKGYESEIYAINEHPKLKNRSKDYRQFVLDFTGEVILHYSLGSPLNELYKNLNSATRSLIYHNITPAKWYKKVNTRVANDIEQGRKELPELLKITDKIVADSKFNAKEIDELGFQSEVLELALNPERWEEEANLGIAAQLQNDPALHLVHIGRFAPNKCIEDVIKVFYFIRKKLEINAKLWLPGIDIDTEVYSFELKRLVNWLGLYEDVKFVGCFADSEIKALYENATAYLCMSEHEGFCIPLVEAMHFGLPVVAYASSAIPDTLGSGGILVYEKRYPEIALLMQKIYQDRNFRSKLIEAGKKRASELSMENFQKNFERVLL